MSRLVQDAPRSASAKTVLRRTALAAGLVAALGVAALGGDDATADPKPTTKVYELVGTPTSFKAVGAAGEGALPPGASFVFTERLDRNGAAFGENTGVCAAVTEERLQCSITTTLPGGTVQVHGVSAAAGVVDLAITGGTGRYAGAGGTVRVDTRPAKDKLRFEIRGGK